MFAEAQQQGRRERLTSAAAVAAFHALFGYALLVGPSGGVAGTAGETLKLINLAKPSPPPPTPLPPPRSSEPRGEAAPLNLKSEASPVIAPPPIIDLAPPPPLAAAPIPALGPDVSLGSAEIEGPGIGSGGEGTGRGSGAGDGRGAGERGGPPIRTRRISGSFSSRDYPREAEKAGAQGIVAARLTVGKTGQVTDCRVRVSSGNAALDRATCRIILKRFRFTPAHDGEGKPTTDLVEWEQTWSLRREDRPEHAEAECRGRADRLPPAAARRGEFLACMASYGWRR